LQLSRRELAYFSVQEIIGAWTDGVRTVVLHRVKKARNVTDDKMEEG